MSWTRPTRDELDTEIQADLATSVTGAAPWIPRSLLRGIAGITAGVADILHAILQYIVRQNFVYSCDDAYVPRHAAEFKVDRLEETAWEGEILITGTAGTALTAGTVFVREDGWRYELDAGVTIGGGGTIAGTATALDLGADGNIASGTLALGSPITGVDTVEVTAQTNAGTDQESIADWRSRVQARKRNPPQGGAEDDYVQWARAVSGVAGVWVVSSLQYVYVFFVVDGTGSGIIPDAGDIASVQSAIEAADASGLTTKRPVTAVAVASAPSAVNVDAELSISPDTTALRDAVEAELEALMLRRAGANVRLSDFWTAIGSVPGLDEFELTSPAAAVTVTDGETAVLNSVAFT